MLKFRIYAPPFNKKSGGIVVLYVLASKLNKLGFESKIITLNNNNIKNEIYNNFTNSSDINDSFVIYAEMVEGNPLNASKIIRWILCDLGKNCDKNIFKTWNKSDIIYYFSSYNPSQNKNLKYLNCFHLFSEFKNLNLNRTHNCFEFRKASKFHSNIIYLHSKSDKSLLEHKKSIIFNNSKYFFCYDPYTFNMILAGFCGCIPIVYPINNVSKKDWTNSLSCSEYLKSINKDYLYGIAYGIDDLKYAQDTFHLFYNEQIEIINFINNSVSLFCNDLSNNSFLTINDIFY
jgi:hypothetical protein